MNYRHLPARLLPWYFRKAPKHLDHFEDVETRQRRRMIHYCRVSVAVALAVIVPSRLITPDVFWTAVMLIAGFVIPLFLVTLLLAHRGHRTAAELVLLTAFCGMPIFAFWIIGSSEAKPQVLAIYGLCLASLMIIWCNATFGIRFWKPALCYLLISTNAVAMFLRMRGLTSQSVLCLTMLVVTTAVMALLSNMFMQRDEREFLSGGQRLLSAIVAGRHDLWAFDISNGRCEILEATPSGPLRTLGLDWDHSLARVHPDDRQYLRHYLRDCLVRGESFTPCQYRSAPDANGECGWYEGIAKVVEYDRKGRPLIMFGMTNNISDQKYLTRQLEQQSQELARAMRAKSDFLATMSHEIRTPLNGVLGMAALLDGPELTPFQSQMVSIIHSSGSILLHILNDVLDFSKIEAGKLSLRPAPFHVKDLVEGSMRSFEPAAHAKCVSTCVSVSPDVPAWLIGDASYLEKVLTHLLSNAVKFTSAGHVELGVSLVSRDAGGRETLRFEVRDTGIGMDQEAQKRLYSPFTQVHGGGLTAESGTGLGLAISKKIVEAMEGRISCSSELGRGTCISVELSLPACDPPATISRGPGRIGPARILVAEDNRVNQAVLMGLLRRLGHDVTLVSDGREAVESVRQGDYDIVLMDCEMPVLSGVEATRRIREIPAFEKLPIIALSAHSGDGLSTLCSPTGMSDYITKPVDLKTLRAALARWL